MKCGNTEIQKKERERNVRMSEQNPTLIKAKKDDRSKQPEMIS